MQLPRGTFREIKKGETIEDLLAELEQSRFSGVCSISSEAGSGTLVYKNGKCILVKFLGKSGDAGCTELQKNRNHEVDAALSSLDEAQIQLSLEFNKTCRLLKVAKPLDAPQKPAPPPHEPGKKPAPPVHAAAPAPAVKAPPLKPAASLFHRPAPPVQPPKAPEPQPRQTGPGSQRPAMPAPPGAIRPPAPHAGVQNGAPAEDIEGSPGQESSFEKDIDTFDTMDLDNVTDKIRNDCKTMIKQLHLEHLMER